MNKRGFTLIELLAVIVILAIISLIAIPIVINMINDSKESSVLNSANFYIDAVENSFANRMLNDKEIKDGTYEILDNGNVCLGRIIDSECSDELEVKVTGDAPSSGTITIEDVVITNARLRYNNKLILMKEGKLVYVIPGCKVTKGNGTNVGDEISCAGEEFYVISNDGATISMLAKYNLEVGYYYDVDTNKGGLIENPSGLQSADAITGTIISLELNQLADYHGITSFSTSMYWSSYSDAFVFVYDSNSFLYEYVENYEKYLIDNGVISAEGTLLSYEQATSLGCNIDTMGCTNGSNTAIGFQWAGNAPEWVFSSTYWLGSASNDMVVFIDSDGIFYGVKYNLEGPGVRPVINISVDEI